MHAKLVNNSDYSFFLTVVYGDSSKVNRRELWGVLRDFGAQCEGEPWLIGEDFNEIQWADEWEGRGKLDYLGAAEFEAAIKGLVELDTIGGKYTWMTGTGLEHTKTRLDRMLASLQWVTIWPRAVLLMLHGSPLYWIACTRQGEQTLQVL